MRSPRLIRVSIGSAVKLGLLKGRMDAEPTTLYMMTYTEGRCSANCAFCSQARSSKAPAHMLSRVTWPSFPLEDVLAKIMSDDCKGSFKRICIQALNYPGVTSDLIEIAKRIKAVSDIPVSVSCQPLTECSMKTLAEIGVDRISVALDAASEVLFWKVKGRGMNGPYTWRGHMENLSKAVEIFGKGRVTTHLIVGLGETDRELLELIQQLIDMGINPSLFAFTPVKGTILEGGEPPSIERYRAIQLCRYLLVNRKIRGESFTYNDNGKLTGVKLRSETERLVGSEAFMTAGCPGCNRPFYNERPKGPIYNYPRDLSSSELHEAIRAASNYIKLTD